MIHSAEETKVQVIKMITKCQDKRANASIWIFLDLKLLTFLTAFHFKFSMHENLLMFWRIVKLLRQFWTKCWTCKEIHRDEFMKIGIGISSLISNIQSWRKLSHWFNSLLFIFENCRKLRFLYTLSKYILRTRFSCCNFSNDKLKVQT